MPPPASPPAPLFSADWLDAHGEHLLAPILAKAGGTRTAECPVCLAAAPVPTGGWVNVRCAACGTDFVATDGSAPPPPPPPLPPVRHSPLAPPPFDTLPPLPDRPVSFTADVRTDPAGCRFVTCPLCHGADVGIAEDVTVAAFPTCPACHRSFLVDLKPDDSPAPFAPAAPVFDPDGRLWTRCPKCGTVALAPGRVGSASVLTCTVCGQRVVVGEGPHPPRHTPLPAFPSIWQRVRRWFGGG